MLSSEKIAFLNKMFQDKPVTTKSSTGKSFTTKYHIPVGLQKLKLSKVEKKETKRKGMWMYVVEFKKDPEHIDRMATKASFKPIYCYHILTGTKDGNFSDQWFKRFTNNLKESDFEKLKKYEGKYFQALVKQKEKVIMVGSVSRKTIEHEILNVYPLDKTDIEFNYLDLYEEHTGESEQVLPQAQN